MDILKGSHQLYEKAVDGNPAEPLGSLFVDMGP